MTLEGIIRALTSATPSGGTCRIGAVSFRVRYCSDIWEWDYKGEIFWDPLDLAEAIARDAAGNPLDRPPVLARDGKGPAQVRRRIRASLPEGRSRRQRKEPH